MNSIEMGINEAEMDKLTNTLLTYLTNVKEALDDINANLEGYRDDLIQVKKNYINQDTYIQTNEVEANNVVVETGVK